MGAGAGGQRAVSPSTSPKAQLSAAMVISISTSAGTLTVTGAKPMPQQFPGNCASMRTSPVSFSLTVKVGEVPSGMKLV